MISKCRLNQEKVSMDGYNTSKKNLILKGMASVDTGKLRSTGSRAWPRSRDEMWAEACEAWRADNSWELRKGVNQAAAFHAPGNIQQGWQQMTVTWKQKSHSLLIFSIIVLANWVFFFFLNHPHPWQYQCDTEFLSGSHSEEIWFYWKWECYLPNPEISFSACSQV